jgi:hypothetical protein
MREFWLTNQNNDKWSLGTSSNSIMYSPTNLITKTTDSYWEGQRNFFLTNSRDQMVTISANVLFKNGMKDFEEFKRWCAVSSTLWLHSKRDGCEERKCKVKLSVTSLSELYGRAIIANLSFARLTPWSGNTITIPFNNSINTISICLDVPNIGDIPSPFYLYVILKDVTGTNSGIIISSIKNNITRNRISSYSLNTDTLGRTPIVFNTTEGNQCFYESSVSYHDLYPTIDFSKDSFFQIEPDIDQIQIYDTKSASTWSGYFYLYPQFGEA